MKFGFYGVNIGACADPRTSQRVSLAAESAGFDSLWVMDHPILPSPVREPSVLPPELPILDPLSTLSFLASSTRSVRLGTGILLLALRNPVVLAKELATIDVLSEGRLILGVGSGYIPQEFSAVGIPFEERGRRVDEGIDVVRTLWGSPRPAFAGRWWRFEAMDAHPRPEGQKLPPIIVGGDADLALRRAWIRGNGWYGVHKDLAATRTLLESLKRVGSNESRPEELGPLEVSITPPTDRELNAQDVDAFASAGVHRLILWPLPSLGDADAQLRYIERSQRLIEQFP